MMRGATRMVARSVSRSAQASSSAAAATLAASQRHFGSTYRDDLGHYKRPYTTDSRSGAHRHPSRRELLRDQRAAAKLNETVEGTSAMEEEEVEAQAPSRSTRQQYPEFHRKKTDDRLAFTSNFREPDMKPLLDAAGSKPTVAAAVSSSSHRMGSSAADVDDTDVTRIYSKEEVRSMRHGEEAAEAGEVMAEPSDDVLDALSSEETPAAAVNTAPPAASAPAAVANAEDAGDDDTDEFAEIRSHPFFMDMLRRVERNMIRFRKETRSLGRYSLEAVDECVRPLLQLTDYPLTATQLSHLSHSISPAVLKSSLRDRTACRRLQLYRSQDTDLLLDWSAEDFLRRRYESVHLSWEPMDVICRRFGWTPEMLSDRDYLLYFSAFPDYVEMAELTTTASGEPKAVPIEDPVARAAEGSIPANRLLLRRRATADAEPSVTESLRLMGTAAVSTPAKGKKAQRMRQHGGDSVADYFGAVEAAAGEVDGDEAVRLQHAADTVPPLRQATHPAGRTVREFSLPKSHVAATSAPAPSVSAAPVAASSAPSSAAAAAAAATEAGDETSFDQKRFEELSNAYHNTKVENSLLRRRVMATENVDKAQELQAELAKGRREVLQLEQELERMRELKRHATTSNTGAVAAANFHVPRGLPQYAEAPEFDRPVKSKNESAVEDIDDDEIEQALRDYKEEEGLMMHAKARPVPAHPATTTTATTTNTAVPRSAPAAAAEEDEYEEVEVEVDEEDGELTAAEEAVAEAKAAAETDVAAPVAAEADIPVAPLSAAAQDQQWQAELEAAVEQQEAEMEEEDESFSAVAVDDSAAAASPSDRLEQLASLHDRLSSAADRARRYLSSVESRRLEVLAKLDTQLADASRKVGKLEAQLSSVEEEQAALTEAMAREEVERKAREVEAQLTAQRERRLAELEEQRERARLAQEEAHRAVERQRAAEREALAMEEELRRKLRDVQSRLRSLKDGHDDSAAAAAPSQAAASPAAPVKAPVSAPVSAPAAAPTAAAEVEEVHESPVSAGQFMCTPEQYDGLHLAADRLKKEIAALEAQMEEEGDEDDETLMAVLAASRADLEELEECISSVQANAKWAAARDAKLAKESSLAARVSDTEAHRLQTAIDNHRFQISLLEKRLHHTSQKAIMTKLRNSIAEARRSISHLRQEQDRLRRAGRDALGLPESVSIAETLAHEGKEPEEEHAAAGAAAAAAAEETSAQATSEAAEADGELAGDAEEGLRAESEEDDAELTAAASPTAGTATTGSGHALVSDADRLRVRLDSMVGDIQHLQDSIEAQERSSDYDDEETEVVLREMKEKLSQLLRLRDQVQRALLEEFANEPAATSGPTSVIRPAAVNTAASAATAAPVVAAARAAPSVRSGPSSLSRNARIRSAAKRLRSAGRSSHASRRR